MNTKIGLIVSLFAFLLVSCGPKYHGQHLFILSGQSNMAGLDPEISFMSTLEAEYGKENKSVLHMSVKGYDMMGKRFPEKSIELLK